MNPPIPFQTIVDACNDAVIVTRAAPLDAPGPEIVYVNKAFTTLTGYTADEALGRDPRFLISPEGDAETRHSLRKALERGEGQRVRTLNRSKAGDDYWVDLNLLPLKDAQGELQYFAAILRDVSDQQEIEARVAELAKRDPLTGLLNRRAFVESVDVELQRHQRTQNPFAILLIDIDGFARVNEEYGKPVGDQVLQYFADLFDLLFRAYDRVARLGDDEFCVLLTDCSIEQAEKSAERMRALIERSQFPAGDDPEAIRLTASVGVAPVVPGDDDFSQLYLRARDALSRARELGGNRVFVLEDV